MEASNVPQNAQVGGRLQLRTSSSLPRFQSSNRNEFSAPVTPVIQSNNASKRGSEFSSPHIDDHTIFWATYDKAADTFDKELVDGWIKSLDSLLIFAALFSAINTAFIMESYKGLQPDPAEMTNALLRLLITHRNDNTTLSVKDLNPLAPHTNAISLNSVFFASLSFSLTAAFGAVTAKQWLTEYSHVGPIKAMHAQGRERQAKFKGLETWHFSVIIELLPLLLQISLFLFFVGVIQFLWVLERKVAMVQLILSAAAVAVYFTTITIGIFIPASPFQTPVTKYISRCVPDIWILLVKTGKRIPRATSFLLFIPVFLSSYIIDELVMDHIFHATQRPIIDSVNFLIKISVIGIQSIASLATVGWHLLNSKLGLKKPPTKLDDEEPEGHTNWDGKDILAAESVVWLLEQSEYPDAIIAALDASLRLPSNLLYSLVKGREGLLDRLITFHNTLLPQTPERHHKWIKSWEDNAVVSGVALSRILNVRPSQPYRYRTLQFTSPSTKTYQVSELSEDITWEDPGFSARVIVAYNHCLIDQRWDVFTDLRWLVSCLTSLKSSPIRSTQLCTTLTDVRQTTATKRLATSVTPIQLALDAITWTIMARPIKDSYEVDLLQALHCTLQVEQPSNIISHVATVLAAYQWSVGSRMKLSFWSYPNPAVLEQPIMGSSHSLNKDKMLLDNVVRALSLVDVADVDPIPDIYCKLLALTEDLFSKSLLRLSRKRPEDADTQSRILRLLSKCVRSTDPPLMKYRNDIIRLFNHAILSYVSDSERNKLAFHGLLGWFNAQSNNDMFSYNNFFSEEVLPPHNHRTLYGAQLYFAVQFLVALPEICKREPSAALLFRQMIHFLNQMMTTRNPDLRWPAYFPPGAIAELSKITLISDSLPQTRDYHVQILIQYNLLDAWYGESALLLWKRALKELQARRLPADWEESVFFQGKVVDMMLDYYWHVTEQGYRGIDQDVLGKYFWKALGEYCHLEDLEQSTTLEEGSDADSNRVRDEEERSTLSDIGNDGNIKKALMTQRTGGRSIVMTEEENRRVKIKEALRGLGHPIE